MAAIAFTLHPASARRRAAALRKPWVGSSLRQAHYSLVVSLATPEVETDIYTPVANEIGINIPVEVEI